MAKLTGPLLSSGAAGSLSDVLTFSSRRSGPQTRFQRRQRDILTSKREAQRGAYGAGVEAWRSLSASEKNYWRELAVGKKMTGYNLFMQNYLLIVPAIYGEAIFGAVLYGQER